MVKQIKIQDLSSLQHTYVFDSNNSPQLENALQWCSQNLSRSNSLLLLYCGSPGNGVSNQILDIAPSSYLSSKLRDVFLGFSIKIADRCH